MSIHRHRSTYNGILFNGIYAGTDPDNPAAYDSAYLESDYRLYELDASRLSMADLHEVRQWMEGAIPNEAYEGIRLLTGRGAIVASSVADLEDKSWALAAAFSPANVVRLSQREVLASFPDEPEGVLPFDWKRDTAAGQLALRWYARPFIGRPVVVAKDGEGFVRSFTFQLVSFSPTCFGQTMQSVALSALSGGDNSVANAGTAITYPQIRVVLSGAGNSDVRLTNVTTGQVLNLDLSDFGALTFWLMTEQGEIINTDRDSRYSCVKSGFVTDLFLVPGTNIITWDKASNVSSVTFRYRDAYA